jgi:flagellar protein FlaI
VLKRFTTDPINVSKTMFTALDLVSIQTQTRVEGHKVRRNKELTEINHYDAENDEINVQTVYQWQAETDEFLKMGDSNTLDDIMFERGWGRQKLERELFKRRIILAYLIKNEISDYVRVAATIQAFINDPDTILALIAKGQLLDSLEDLREMESVDIQVDPEKEALVPRPDPDDERLQEANQILDKAEDQLFEDYRQMRLTGLGVDEALEGMSAQPDTIEASPASADEFDFGGSVDDEFEVTDEDLEDLTTGDYEDEELSSSSAAWADSGGGMGFEDDDSGGAIWSDDGGSEESSDGAAQSEPERELETEAETEPETGSGSAADADGDTQVFGESEGETRDAGGTGGESDDEMESIFGGDEAEDDVSLFGEEDDESIFGDSDEDEGDDDDESIFGSGGGGE